jgi:hypothetical protein
MYSILKPDYFLTILLVCLYSIYVDVVINHLTGHGASGTGSAGSSFDGPSQSYPGIPYSTLDFHQPYCDISNYNDPINVSTLNSHSKLNQIVSLYALLTRVVFNS